MNVIFSQLKQKDVINLNDGKNLGRICDITFTFPEGDVTGFTATGCKGFRFSKQEVSLPFSAVVKVGEDAVLVKVGKEREKDCPPPPPSGKRPVRCPPPPQNCPPPQGHVCPPDRRSLDEYE